MQLKLHIFEERYKKMINACIEEQKPFGVVLIKDGIEALGTMATPHTVGCTAQITDLQRLPYDRMNIVATGQQRFRISKITKTNPFLVADVDYFSPAVDNENQTNQYARLLRPLVIEYLDILSRVEEINFNKSQIPRAPRAIAQVASILLQAENEKKQELLSIQRLSLLMRQLVEIYNLETMLLNVRISPPDDTLSIGPFSSN
jgi:Lon protease-like protein